MVTFNQVMIRLLLSLLFSGLVGLERQIQRHTAGLRTHILVGMGSCLIMLTSLYVFDIYKDIMHVDPSRIAAGVITGIGFLGGGAILRSGEVVRGLTTAASLWMVAAIGLATGCGFLGASFFTTILTLVVLFFLKYLEKVVFGKEEAS